MMKEIDRVNKERDDQRRQYDGQIKDKEDIVQQVSTSNDYLKQ